MNVLERLKAVRRHTFPYALIKPALPDELYAELMASWPNRKVPPGENSVTLSRGRTLTARPDLPDVWRKFITAHQSQTFFDEVNRIFALGLAGAAKARGGAGQIGVECQIADTSAVTKPSSVKGPHWDSPRTKWAGILYCRHDQDYAGGNLRFYAPLEPRFDTERFCLNPGEPFLTVPYEANSFVCWVNSPKSIHGVSIRNPTTVSRRYVNFAIDV